MLANKLQKLQPPTDMFKPLRENWGIIIAIVAIIMAWSTLNAKVDANAKEVDNVRTLIERVIILEEHDLDFSADIAEIKQELKEIKILVR